MRGSEFLTATPFARLFALRCAELPFLLVPEWEAAVEATFDVSA